MTARRVGLLLLIVGAAVGVVGVGLIYPPMAIILGGLGLAALGLLIIRGATDEPVR